MQSLAFRFRTRALLERSKGGRRVVIVALAVVALGACSSEQLDDAADRGGDIAGDIGSLQSADVEEALRIGIGDVGIAFDPDTFACSSIEGVSVGAQVECDFTNDGQPVHLVAEVLGLNGTEIEFDVRTEARPVPADVLADAVATRASLQLGGPDVSATCAGELAPEVGETVGCNVSANGEDTDVDVIVDAVDGGRIDWRMELA